MVWPAIIAGVASLAGSALAAKMSGDSADKAAEKNTEFQREFAQNGVTWKVADAKRAGLHPLAALGANTISYSPSFVGTDYSGVGRSISDMGQDISRAVRAKGNQVQRYQDAQVRQMQLESMEKDLQYKTLQNQKLERELQNQPPNPTLGPAGIMSGQTGVNQIPSEQVISGRLGIEKGPRPMNKIDVDNKGRIYFTLGKSSEEALENDWYNQVLYLGNRTIDYIYNVGRGWVDRVLPNPAYRKDINSMREHLSKEFGIPMKYIQYKHRYDQYHITPEGQKLLNRGRMN